MRVDDDILVRQGPHPALVGGLVVGTVWLILQNAALLAVLAWLGAPGTLALARAALRLTVAILGELWWIPVVALALIGLVALVARAGLRRQEA